MSAWVQVLIVGIILVFVAFIALVFYVFVIEGSSFQQQRESYQQEYNALIGQIEKKHREARGEVGLQDKKND